MVDRSFGTLLGPGITGPALLPLGGWFRFGFFWFPAHGLGRTGCIPFWGVCVAVGVTGLLFGNCIVDASIL